MPRIASGGLIWLWQGKPKDTGGMWRQKINRVGYKRQRDAENMRTIMLVYGSGMIH